MKLQAINIKRFRSIDSGELTNCGGFNVLIGKNNSGKSNILSAIAAFFHCVQEGKVATLDPPIGKGIDFYYRNSELPIEITLTFSLSLAERDALVRDIVLEAPQMKNAVDGMNPSLSLYATVSILPSPRIFSYVSKLALTNSTSKSSDNFGERIILSINSEAALELFEQLSHSRQLQKDVEGLTKIDKNAIRYLFESKSERVRTPSSYLTRQIMPGEASRDFRRNIESIIDASSSADEVFNEIRTLTSRMQEEATFIQREPLRNKIGTFSGEEVSIPNYVRNLLAKIDEIKVLYLRERRKVIGKEEAGRLLELKVRRGGTEALKSIQETVTALLGVQIDAFRSDTPSQGEALAELDVDNFLVQVNGSGIREALRLVLDFEFEQPKILLVEEPEVHLHPALEIGMMRYLKRISNECQVFLTTHSTNFLDTGDMKNVYLISKPISTSIRLLDVEEAEAQIPRELGIRLSSFFMFDRLVFVEGPSDEDIFREWASVLGVNLSQANVGFIHMGGVRNFAHFAAEKTLSFLSKRQVKIWFLMDRDERDDEEINKIQEKLGNKSIVKFLENREIENYLFHPRPIIEFIKIKRQLSGSKSDESVPTEVEVQQIIEDCAERLKQIAIDKRVAKHICSPVYPSRTHLFDDRDGTTILHRASREIDRMIAQLEEAKSRADSIVEQQSEEINNAWQRNKLSLVPGDVLLDMVFQQYNLRFRKERDSSRLAALMTENEIASEIKQIIREIGS